MLLLTERSRCAPLHEVPARPEPLARLGTLLRGAGHDAVHTLELGLERADDAELLDVARADGRVVISGDADFGALLALSHETSPSVILFRGRHHRSADAQASLILEHLDDISADLVVGAVIIVGEDRIRVRRLPLLHPGA